MAKKATKPKAEKLDGMVTLNRLDETGGTVELDHAHAIRILALEQSMGVRLHEYTAENDAPGQGEDSENMGG